VKVTISKKRTSTSRTLTSVDIEELVSAIRESKYAEEVVNLRSLYPVLVRDRLVYKDLTSKPDAVDAVPSVCFSGVFRHKNGQQEMTAMNPLFVVSVNHLASYQEVEYLRELASQLPYTYLSFMGATGRSLKIVCQARCDKSTADLTPDEMQKLLSEAYCHASKYYSAQLKTSVDIRQPTLYGGCKISADPHLCFNPNAEEIFVNDLDAKKVVLPVVNLEKDDARLLPGYDLRQTQRYQFEDYLSQALEQNLGRPIEDAAEDVLHTLARYCHDGELPQEMCIYRVLRNPDFGNDENYVRRIFDNADKRDLVKGQPFRHLTPEILLTLKTQAFMKDRYEMRRNVLTGVVEYRIRDGRNMPFHNLTQYAINSMTQDALEQGLKSWDKDVRRYIESDKIGEFDPVNDYLDHLPQWDGVDRIEAMAARVPTDNADWQKNFHVWMLSMVAHWMGKDLLHGNAYTPLLIGTQGCGKSSFCKNILPSCLSSYYYDRIDFKNEQSADLALTRFALINIDEFDQLTARRQAILKYLLQKSEVKTRKAYGVSIEELRRYASFIATTNNMSPLSDETGSRRFICIFVNGRIDYLTPVDHDQMYAQAVSEINAGARFWFDDNETAVIMAQNEDFQLEDGLKTMVNTYFLPARDDKNGEWMLLADILSILRQHFRNLKDDVGTMRMLGKKMKAIGYLQHRGTGGSIKYLVKTKS
jgi:hypothetical protein